MGSKKEKGLKVLVREILNRTFFTQFEKIVMRHYTTNKIRYIYSMVSNVNFLRYMVVCTTFYRGKKYAYKW